MRISLSVIVRAPIEVVWCEFNDPRSIVEWDASPEWHTVSCTNDVRVGGRLTQRIMSRVHGEPFLFSATYVCVEPLRLLEWQTSEGQEVRVEFADNAGLVEVQQTFTADPAVTIDDQRDEWQGVLNSFAQFVERSTE